MMTVIPGSQSISDLLTTIEFVKTVATAEGLEAALKTLIDKQRDLESAAAINHNTKRMLDDSAVKINADRAVVDKMLADAQKVSQKALADAAIADAAMKRSQAGTDELSRLSNAFELYKKDAEGKIAQGQRDLDERQQAITTADEGVRAMKEDYDAKLAALKGLVA